MNAPTSSAAAEKSIPVGSKAEAENSKAVEQNIPRTRYQIEIDAERIRSSIARLTANSTNGLEGLASELQELQKFLNSEVARVQDDIESALAGIKIIVETIGPWKTIHAPPPTSPRGVRAGPAANIEGSQPRR
jgi:exonuclease VII large subunit